MSAVSVCVKIVKIQYLQKKKQLLYKINRYEISCGEYRGFCVLRIFVCIFERTDPAMIQNRESMTAKLCAFARAWHSNKTPEKVFDDYLAFDLMADVFHRINATEQQVSIVNFKEQSCFQMVNKPVVREW